MLSLSSGRQGNTFLDQKYRRHVTVEVSLGNAINSQNPRGRVFGLIFAGYVPLASQSPYPIIVYFILWPIIQIIDPILVTFGKIYNFSDQ